MSTKNFQPRYASVGALVPDRLVADDHPIITRSISLIEGQNLARGSLLGRITASGKYTLSLTAASDGSQNPVAILAEDVNATAADKATIAYESGSFNSGAMTFGASHTAASAALRLRELGIYLKTSVPA